MALKNTVTLTENPFENAVIWEKRDPVKESKHRLRHTKNGDKIDTIAIGKDEDSDEYDYCILKAATKGSNPLPRILPSDREIRTHISSSSYNTFAKRHTGGPVYSVSARTVTRTPVSPTSPSCKHSDLSARIRTNANQGKQSVDEEDVQLFCCGRTVESLVDTATCMCCVKGALYHCTKDSDDEAFTTEDPCSCEQDLPRRTCVTRWMCIALCSIFLPCILCYFPARGCLQVCTCYRRQRIASSRRPKHRVRKSEIL
ncbi:protein sprouty [Nematostella vectensis]|uniref:protein sprouty n=1 Tax=Nematostella vectensis TaxID=45351 RepID=UPI00207753FB|nr:protein sprouty [Nematostella vectensis]XP_032222708.2 protein sprouty [Nematostella vectensis]